MSPDEAVAAPERTSPSSQPAPRDKPDDEEHLQDRDGDTDSKPLVKRLRFLSTFVSASRPLYNSSIVSLPSPDVLLAGE